MWKKLSGVGVVGVLLAAAVPGGAAVATGPKWDKCTPEGIELCTTLKVPLDWSKPSGPTTNVFVVKVPARDQSKKRGAIVFNPGGPGGAGGSIYAAGMADQVMGPLRDKYDLVSFDPRGTGASSQLDCGPVLRPGVPVFPKNKAEYDRMVASSRATGQACLKKHGNLMRNLDTRTAARDIDAIRAALGERKLSFFGMSYGSFMGTVYAQLFPQRVDRMLLDGIVDHSQGSQRFMLEEAKEMESEFNAFIKWCATDKACELHGQNVGKLWDDTVRKADKTPLPGGSIPVTGDVMRMALPALLPKIVDFGADWTNLAGALAKAAKGDGSGFYSSYIGYAETAYAAVSCMDLPGELKGYADARARITLARAVAPRVGAAVEGWIMAAACSGWPIPPSNPWAATPIKNTPTILIATATHDPSTPIAGARGLHRQIRNSHLLVAEAHGHTAYFNSQCAREAVTAYFLDGKLPARRACY
ncbi:alpha/beta fold hydrolase [Kribbella sandramycini]|uniref:Alpha/beta fold hydrolase n=1 Tax=Kribbella sandramycini TaxID=60450 RepID=A0A7Y4L861_9ACTN|nr:alpha/beta hydrolase [Kribbella sandramycini]MBB6565920.1 pimeloyl-ACP methyl ester carboxylesterase [Kribbella sandramycini]NOL44926.1 alpha/beta fold hydrolase [Kribbella sandramycini]